MSAERQLRNDASMPMEEAEDNDVVWKERTVP